MSDETKSDDEANKENSSSASISTDLLCVTRYTPVSCGVTPAVNGRFLLLTDVLAALEHVTEDDSCIHGRLRDFMENLEEDNN